ncbi:MAG: hypothetical protein WC326_06265 [Candidatus Delongbacteria bacterium]
MASVKERLTALIQAQPDDASFEQILRELAFARLVERGLEDARAGRFVSHAVLAERVRRWPA